MDQVQEYLIKLSDKLDKDGLQKCSDVIDDVIQSSSLQKMAQYVGAIGYVLKQNRAMSNCIRKKRVESNSSMQDVVFDCLKEYQDGQQYDNNEWTEKYAEVIQSNPDEFDKSHLDFIAAMRESSDIEKHFNKVVLAAETLKNNSVNDPIFETILKHAETMHELVEKDGGTQLNFKLAAPWSPEPRKRSLWSRFWNPSANSWRSWTKKRQERGEDEDTIHEMKLLIEEMTEINHFVKQMKTSLARMKSEVMGYTSGSGYQTQSTPATPTAPAPPSPPAAASTVTAQFRAPTHVGTPARDLMMSALPQGENEDTINKVVQKVSEIDPKDWNKTVLILQQLQTMLRNNTIYNEYNQQILSRLNASVMHLFGFMNRIYGNVEKIQKIMKSLRRRETILGRNSFAGNRNTYYRQKSPAEEFASLEQSLDKVYENPFDDQAIWFAQRAHAVLWDKLRYIERSIGSNPGSGTAINPSLSNNPDNPESPESETESETQPAQQPAHQPGAEDIQDEEIARIFDRLNTEGVDPGSLLNVLETLSVMPEMRQVFGPVYKRFLDFYDSNQSTNKSTSNPEEWHSHLGHGASTVDKIVKIADAVDTISPELGDLLDQYLSSIVENTHNFPSFSEPVKE